MKIKKEFQLNSDIHILKLSLESNSLDFLAIYHQIKLERISFSNLKIKIISLIGFYECFLKWALSLEDKNSICKDNHPFDEHKFEIGDFHSISFSKCLFEAVKKNWLSIEEKDLISKFESIRNKIIHFAFVGDDQIYMHSNGLIIDYLDFEKHEQIISKMIVYFNGKFSRAALGYKDTLEFYLNLNKILNFK